MTSTLAGGFFLVVHCSSSMSISYDFQLLDSGVRGMSLVMSMNEDAFSFITDELDMFTVCDGSCPLDNYHLSAFIETAERAQLSCDFA
jgi:hypothetical protein